MRTLQFEPIDIAGPVGPLDTLRLAPATALRGIALVAHPNPLQGGTHNNKIVHTLAKVLARQGYVAYCPNLRGVGRSGGEHDHGQGEVDDMAAVLDYAVASHGPLPLILAGFSFGTYVQTQLAERLGHDQVERLILIGPACSRATLPAVPVERTLVIHGEADEVVPLASVLDWARPQDLPVVVAPGVGHFFHGKLTLLADWVNRLSPAPDSAQK
ncbi:alpha/beta hydrolase [Chitinimonas lacunae]|uniref:Alpha/beta hydrolase n=1 Tax=Chitinimonas lacunae TaxID=1963018 RepID=A0ABV8MX65_9NEIS